MKFPTFFIKMIAPNWVKELTKIDDEDLFIDERRLKKALKFYETKKNAPRFAVDIKSEVDEGFAEDPDEPIYHRFPRWFSESEEFSKSLVNICKSNVGSEDYMNIWYMMDIALTCLITGKVYSLNAMEGEYEDEAYQVFIALMKHIAKDYDNFSKKFDVTNNLSEANKFFFGTENTNEVKKLFESADTYSSDNYKIMNDALKQLNKCSFNEKFVKRVWEIFKPDSQDELGALWDISYIRPYSRYYRDKDPYPQKFVRKYNPKYFYTALYYRFFFLYVMTFITDYTDENSSDGNFDFFEYYNNLGNIVFDDGGNANDEKFFANLGKVVDLYTKNAITGKIPSYLKKLFDGATLKEFKPVFDR